MDVKPIYFSGSSSVIGARRRWWVVRSVPFLAFSFAAIAGRGNCANTLNLGSGASLWVGSDAGLGSRFNPDLLVANPKEALRPRLVLLWVDQNETEEKPSIFGVPCIWRHPGLRERPE